MPTIHPSRRPRLDTGRVFACIVASILAALALAAWSPAHAEDTDALVPESPYFHVKSDDPALDALPLKATQVDVRIAGVIAEVTVTQHYRNEGRRPIEARYVFPGSTRAAVHAMSVRLGERLISAQIREKQRARLEYDSAQSRGQDHRAAGAGAAQRVLDERGQHPARRRRARRAAVHRADRARRRPVPLRLPHRGGAALPLAHRIAGQRHPSRPPHTCSRASRRTWRSTSRCNCMRRCR